MKEFNKVLLLTSVCCMACDGEIAQEEVDLIKMMARKKHLFGDIEIDKELDILVNEINIKGKSFLKEYLNILAENNLTEEEELQVVDVAVQTIRADNCIKYSEIMFFKVIRSNLKVVSDETILEKIDGIDENYIAQDICNDNLQTYDEYFNSIELMNFDLSIFNKNATGTDI